MQKAMFSLADAQQMLPVPILLLATDILEKEEGRAVGVFTPFSVEPSTSGSGAGDSPLSDIVLPHTSGEIPSVVNGWAAAESVFTGGSSPSLSECVSAEIHADGEFYATLNRRKVEEPVHSGGGSCSTVEAGKLCQGARHALQQEVGQAILEKLGDKERGAGEATSRNTFERRQEPGTNTQEELAEKDALLNGPCSGNVPPHSFTDAVSSSCGPSAAMKSAETDSGLPSSSSSQKKSCTNVELSIVASETARCCLARAKSEVIGDLLGARCLPQDSVFTSLPVCGGADVADVAARRLSEEFANGQEREADELIQQMMMELDAIGPIFPALSVGHEQKTIEAPLLTARDSHELELKELELELQLELELVAETRLEPGAAQVSSGGFHSAMQQGVDLASSVPSAQALKEDCLTDSRSSHGHNTLATEKQRNTGVAQLTQPLVCQEKLPSMFGHPFMNANMSNVKWQGVTADSEAKAPPSEALWSSGSKGTGDCLERANLVYFKTPSEERSARAVITQNVGNQTHTSCPAGIHNCRERTHRNVTRGSDDLSSRTPAEPRQTMALAGCQYSGDALQTLAEVDSSLSVQSSILPSQSLRGPQSKGLLSSRVVSKHTSRSRRVLNFPMHDNQDTNYVPDSPEPHVHRTVVPDADRQSGSTWRPLFGFRKHHF